MAGIRFEYHTFLHHSQTVHIAPPTLIRFEYHTFLHHSQTLRIFQSAESGLSTIHFYIILKLVPAITRLVNSLSTIHFYIILKPQIQK